MIISEKFTFVHIPKTGGTWMRQQLKQLPSFGSEFSNHHPWSQAPANHSYAFAIVRNPWEWYVELYSHFHSNYVNRTHEFRQPESKWGQHQRTIEKIFGGTFEQMFEHVFDNKTTGLFGGFADSVKTLTEGGAPWCLKFFKMEQGLANILLQVLEESRQAIPEKFLHRIRLQDGVRVNDHSHLGRELRYTRALRDVVAERDAEIISKFGYEFPERLAAVEPAPAAPPEEEVAPSEEPAAPPEEEAVPPEPDYVEELEEVESAPESKTLPPPAPEEEPPESVI